MKEAPVEIRAYADQIAMPDGDWPAITFELISPTLANITRLATARYVKVGWAYHQLVH
jgi:hypothetical protein